MQSTSWEMLGWMKHKLESRFAGRTINNLRYADVTTLRAEIEDELKNFLMKVKESEKAGLKLNIQKTKIMASGPITPWKIDNGNSDRLFSWPPKSLQMVNAAVKGEGDDRGWDGWMASLTQWTWAWARSGSWWWTEKPGVLQSGPAVTMGSQRIRHHWATELTGWWELAERKLKVNKLE